MELIARPDLNSALPMRLSMKNNTALFVSAGILGVLVAFALFEIPKLPAIFGSRYNNLDVKFVLIGCGSILIAVFQFAFARGRRSSPLMFAGLGATLIFGEIFNVGFIKFTACDFLLSGKHRHMYHDSNGAPVTPEERCRKLVYN